MIKRFSILALSVAALSLVGCTASTDGRTGLRGELCAFGYCLAPQAMSAAAQPVPQTAILAGSVVAPATVVSQPALATQTHIASVQSFGAPACAIPAAPAYIPPAAPPPQRYLEK